MDGGGGGGGGGGGMVLDCSACIILKMELKDLVKDIEMPSYTVSLFMSQEWATISSNGYLC